MISVDCMGLAFLTQPLLPQWLQKNIWHIINVPFTASDQPYKGDSFCAVSKNFVQQLSLNTRADPLNTAVRVSHIDSGRVTDSEFSLVSFNGDLYKTHAVYDDIEALTSAAITKIVLWVLTQSAHVNINNIGLLSINQALQRTVTHTSSS